MNWYPLLGLLALASAALCLYLAITKKPTVLWIMDKTQVFVKVLGENGTVNFFIIVDLAVAILGICFFTL